MVIVAASGKDDIRSDAARATGVPSACVRPLLARDHVGFAQAVRPLVDQDYGSREYSARDPEGNLWSFGTYNPAAPS